MSNQDPVNRLSRPLLAVVVAIAAFFGTAAMTAVGESRGRVERIHKPTPIAAEQKPSEVVKPGPQMPTAWLSPIERCARRTRFFCDGPRRVPAPHGRAAKLASTLGLGTEDAGLHLLSHPPLDDWLNAVEGKLRDDLLWPVPDGWMGRGFGYVRRASLRHIRHDGVDIIAPRHSHVRAANDGLVAYSDNDLSGYGNVVILLHPDGSTTLYGHLEAAYVFAGQPVERGHILGEVGTTGLSRGPHLHFEWHREGRALNPRRMFHAIPPTPDWVIELRRVAQR